MKGINVVGVQFRRAGSIYDFASGDRDLRTGDDVVVETDRGPSLAKIAVVRFASGDKTHDKELKAILRTATLQDLDTTGKLTSDSATIYTRELVESLKIKMTVLQCEVQLGGNKVIVYFSAPGRVDFRDLLKELARGLKARVDLKQVGPRDEAKLIGGIGICGREFCCSSFLREFVPVSIKMAKNQNLALNPSKVSGGCGRLLCCLTYENDTYTEFRKKLPPRGAKVRSMSDGVTGIVVKGDILNQVIVMETDTGQRYTVALQELELVEYDTGPTGDQTEADAWGEGIDLATLVNPD